MAKKIELNANSFKGRSGTEYIVYPSLTVKRFQVFEQLQVELEYGASLSAFRQEVTDAYNLFNQMKFADGCTRLNNLVNGLERIKNKGPHPVLMMCALFICPENEDQSSWNEAEAQTKIEDWEEIDMAFFLSCATRLALRFTRGFSSDTLDYFNQQEESEEGS